MKKIYKLALVAATVAPAISMAAGGGPDLSSLTSGVDFTTVVTALLAIAGLLASVYVAIRGAKVVLGMIRGA